MILRPHLAMENAIPRSHKESDRLITGSHRKFFGLGLMKNRHRNSNHSNPILVQLERRTQMLSSLVSAVLRITGIESGLSMAFHVIRKCKFSEKFKCWSQQLKLFKESRWCIQNIQMTINNIPECSQFCFEDIIKPIK